jgi:hypothetical protein
MLPGRVPSAPPGSTPEGKDGEISDEVVKWKDELNAKVLSGVGVHDGPAVPDYSGVVGVGGKEHDGNDGGPEQRGGQAWCWRDDGSCGCGLVVMLGLF